MEKLDRPANESLSGEGEIDPDSVLGLFKSFRFGKDNIPARKVRSMAAETAAPDNTTEVPDEEDNNGSHVGNTSVHENISSVSSNSEPMIPETLLSQTGSNNDPGSNNEPNSNEEIGYSSLEASSANLPNVEKEPQQKVEDDAEEEAEEEESERSSSESEEKSNLEKFLAIQDIYELYCPTCSSCITRNVILETKKRGNHVDLSAELKPNGMIVNESNEIEEIELPDKVHVPKKEEGVMYTCLACLKYYIRLGESKFS